MNRLLSKSITALILAMTMLPQAWAGNLPGLSRGIGKAEVVDVYAGRTWVWKDGRSGLYFMRDGTLKGYRAGAAAKRSGAGNWTVDPKGRMCVNVRWYGHGGTDRSRSCWNHRNVGGIVWKQNVRRGHWYSVRGISRESSRVQDGNVLAGRAGR